VVWSIVASHSSPDFRPNRPAWNSLQPEPQAVPELLQARNPVQVLNSCYFRLKTVVAWISNVSFSMNPSPAGLQIRSPGKSAMTRCWKALLGRFPHGMVTLAPQTAGATSRIVVRAQGLTQAEKDQVRFR
jgi:hypothetical protein